MDLGYVILEQDSHYFARNKENYLRKEKRAPFISLLKNIEMLIIFLILFHQSLAVRGRLVLTARSIKK